MWLTTGKMFYLTNPSRRAWTIIIHRDSISLLRTASIVAGRVLRRPLWLTEFACSEASSVERLPAEGQMAYMREAIPLLEREDSIEMYAWLLGKSLQKERDRIQKVGNGWIQIDAWK